MAKDAKNKDVKNKKHFFKDFKAELKKVIWPTPKQIVNNTIAVITIVLITAVIVFALDSIFNLVNEKGINKLKANVRKTESVEETQETESTDETQEDEDADETQDDEETDSEEENDTQEAEDSAEDEQ